MPEIIEESASGVIQDQLDRSSEPRAVTDDLIRVLVRVKPRQTDPDADDVVHSLWYVCSTIGTLTPTDWTNFATAIMKAFTGQSVAHTPFSLYQGRSVEVRTYQMSDTPPRIPTADVVYTPSVWETGVLAPRRIATCLSFWGFKNAPSTRGRIYIGPLLSSDVPEKCTPAIQEVITPLAQDLADCKIGTTSSWVIYSPTKSQVQVVTTAWCNDQWDSIDSRTPKELTRTTVPVTGNT